MPLSKAKLSALPATLNAQPCDVAGLLSSNSSDIPNLPSGDCSRGGCLTVSSLAPDHLVQPHTPTFWKLNGFPHRRLVFQPVAPLRPARTKWTAQWRARRHVSSRRKAKLSLSLSLAVACKSLDCAAPRQLC